MVYTYSLDHFRRHWQDVDCWSWQIRRRGCGLMVRQCSFDICSHYLRLPLLSSRLPRERIFLVLETKIGFRGAASTSPNGVSRIALGTPFNATRFAANLALLSTPISDAWKSKSPSSHVDVERVPSIACTDYGRGRWELALARGKRLISAARTKYDPKSICADRPNISSLLQEH